MEITTDYCNAGIVGVWNIHKTSISCVVPSRKSACHMSILAWMCAGLRLMHILLKNALATYQGGVFISVKYNSYVILCIFLNIKPQNVARYAGITTKSNIFLAAWCNLWATYGASFGSSSGATNCAALKYDNPNPRANC